MFYFHSFLLLLLLLLVCEKCQHEAKLCVHKRSRSPIEFVPAIQEKYSKQHTITGCEWEAIGPRVRVWRKCAGIIASSAWLGAQWSLRPCSLGARWVQSNYYYDHFWFPALPLPVCLPATRPVFCARQQRHDIQSYKFSCAIIISHTNTLTLV